MHIIPEDPAIRTQNLARRLAQHYHIKLSTIVVSFNSALPVPARIEISSSLDFFIELRSEYRDKPRAIMAILAREIAHIFLHQAGIRFHPEFENEVLTDTTAAYLGCATTLLNGTQTTCTNVKTNFLGTSIENTIRHFGYITLCEFGYIHAKRCEAFGRNTIESFHIKMPNEYFLAGRSQLLNELSARPYSPPPLDIWRILRRIRAAVIKQPQQSTTVVKLLTFKCACCSQKLRISLNGKEITVRCPICDSRFPCYT